MGWLLRQVEQGREAHAHGRHVLRQAQEVQHAWGSGMEARLNQSTASTLDLLVIIVHFSIDTSS